MRNSVECNVTGGEGAQSQSIQNLIVENRLSEIQDQNIIEKAKHRENSQWINIPQRIRAGKHNYQCLAKLRLIIYHRQ